MSVFLWKCIWQLAIQFALFWFKRRGQLFLQCFSVALVHFSDQKYNSQNGLFNLHIIWSLVHINLSLFCTFWKCFCSTKHPGIYSVCKSWHSNGLNQLSLCVSHMLHQLRSHYVFVVVQIFFKLHFFKCLLN